MAQQQEPPREHVETPEPRTKQGFPGDEENTERYSCQGVHGQYQDQDDPDPNQYNEQGRFSDVNNEDPYSNLEDDGPGSTAGGEGLYDLEQSQYGQAEPLANPDKQSLDKPDQVSTEGNREVPLS